MGNCQKGYSNNILIPAQPKVTNTVDTTVKKFFFYIFNAQYQNMTKYGIRLKLQLETLTKDEIALLPISFSEFLPFVLDHPKKGIKNIDTNNLAV